MKGSLFFIVIEMNFLTMHSYRRRTSGRTILPLNKNPVVYPHSLLPIHIFSSPAIAEISSVVKSGPIAVTSP